MDGLSLTFPEIGVVFDGAPPPSTEGLDGARIPPARFSGGDRHMDVRSWVPGSRAGYNLVEPDHALRAPDIQRFYELAMGCFLPRNFGEDALASTIQGMRFDLEIVRRFHPDAHDAHLYEAGGALSRRLALDSVAILRELLAHVQGAAGSTTDAALVARLATRARTVEADVREQMLALARRLQERVGRGQPLTFLGDRVATPLQRAVAVEVTT